jgi:hypothetical protein
LHCLQRNPDMQIAEQKHTASIEAFHLGIGAKSKRNLET